MTPERAFYQRIRECLSSFHFIRIENRVLLGTPDCLVGTRRHWVTMELKVVKKGRQIHLSPHQIAFHLKAADFDLPAFIVVQYWPPGCKKVAGTELILFDGSRVLEIVERGIDAEALGRWPLSAAPWRVVEFTIENS